MYRSILVPLDGSSRAEVILPHVEDLARCYHAQIILLGIVEPVPIALTSEMVYAGIDLESYEQRLRETQEYLAAKQKELHDKGIAARIEVGRGPVVEGIINTAKQKRVDLIAMVSHGRTGLARVFYGSVAAGVLHQIDRPLLLVRSLDT